MRRMDVFLLSFILSALKAGIWTWARACVCGYGYARPSLDDANHMPNSNCWFCVATVNAEFLTEYSGAWSHLYYRLNHTIFVTIFFSSLTDSKNLFQGLKYTRPCWERQNISKLRSFLSFLSSDANSNPLAAQLIT